MSSTDPFISMVAFFNRKVKLSDVVFRLDCGIQLNRRMRPLLKTAIDNDVPFIVLEPAGLVIVEEGGLRDINRDTTLLEWTNFSERIDADTDWPLAMSRETWIE
jgi:hypothetical protein